MSAIANSNQPEDKSKTSRVKSYWHNKLVDLPWKKLSSLVIAIALCFYLTACGNNNKPDTVAPSQPVSISAGITEVSPPNEIQRLSRLLDLYEPQINILSPRPEQVLTDTQVSIKLDVKNLPIFKNVEFGMGPHIHVALDNQEYKALYDLNQPVTFDNLSVGTHTIRAFASRPWHESFKNKGAYAQATFHVLTATGENTPEAKTPLLTYSRPVGTYGAEPIMLDFYLQNAPLHLLGKENEVIDDWQVRATVDGQSFTFDRWEPIYLKGFKTGQNWVKLELLEPDGDTIANVFNSTAHLINYQPDGSDILSRLVRGEKIANIEAIVNPDYVPSAPEVKAEPEIIPAAEPVSPAPEVVSPVPAAKAEAPKAEPVKPAPVPTVAPEAPQVEMQTKKPAIAEPIKPILPAKEKVAPVSKPISKPTEATSPQAKSATEPVHKNYLKDYFSDRAKAQAAAKATEKPEMPATSSEVTAPSVTDLSATNSTPIKVLNKK
ncbi:hypothetical protein HCU40_03915 [Pseudanabaena biceps]|nr:hypothetical protein [Pseudanabaena biceps]